MVGNPDGLPVLKATPGFTGSVLWMHEQQHESQLADGGGLRVLKSQSVLVYGAGLYFFFDNNSTTCSNATIGETYQTAIFDIESTLRDVDVYNLNTTGATSMINRNGVSLASYLNNLNLFLDIIALFRSNLVS